MNCVSSAAYASPANPAQSYITQAAPTVTYGESYITQAAPTVTYGAPVPAPMSAFDMMDRNHDGVITRSEFNQAVQQPAVTYAAPPVTYAATAPAYSAASYAPAPQYA